MCICINTEYWPEHCFKNILNNKITPIIPPSFYENRFVTDFKKNAELFNSFFAKQ